jgi:hypothetical protein
VVASVCGTLAVVAALLTHPRRILSPWLLLGLLPGLVGAWICFGTWLPARAQRPNAERGRERQSARREMTAWDKQAQALSVAKEAGAVSDAPNGESVDSGARLPWYVYDRHANLLRIAGSLSEAEEWAFAFWEVVELGDREEVAENDYYYLLYAKKPEEGDFHTRDFQARIARQDRVIALGRDPDATPRHPGDQ